MARGWAQIISLVLLSLLVLATHSTAKPHRNIHRLGSSVSPIEKNDSSNIDIQSPRGPANAWLKLFTVVKPKRPTSKKDNVIRNIEDDNVEPLISKQTFASGMAFLAGAADVFSFRMTKSYANMMTGNVIKIAAAMGEQRLDDALPFAGIVFFYALGCTIYRTIVNYFAIHAQENSKRHVMARSTASQLLLAMFALSDYLFYTNPTASKSINWIVPMLPLSMGFGILNAASTDILGGTVTFAMTSHIGKVAQGMSDWLMDRKQGRSATKQSASILSFFVMGAFGAAWLASSGPNHATMKTKTPGLTLPAAMLVGRNVNIPIFTVVGVFAVALIYLIDWPLHKFTLGASSPSVDA